MNKPRQTIPQTRTEDYPYFFDWDSDLIPYMRFSPALIPVSDELEIHADSRQLHNPEYTSYNE